MSVSNKYTSLKDFTPEIKLTKKNEKTVAIAKYVKQRLQKYKRDKNLRSDSHAVHSLIVENEMLRSLMAKIDTAIKRAIQEGNPDYFIAVLHENASPQEKAMFDLIWRGGLI